MTTSWLTDELSDAARVYGENAHAKFPDSTPTKAALHLAEEANELIGATLGLSAHTPAQEAAAVFLVLSHWCHMQGVDLGQAVAAEWDRIAPLPVAFDPASGFPRVVKPEAGE